MAFRMLASASPSPPQFGSQCIDLLPCLEPKARPHRFGINTSMCRHPCCSVVGSSILTPRDPGIQKPFATMTMSVHVARLLPKSGSDGPSSSRVLEAAPFRGDCEASHSQPSSGTNTGYTLSIVLLESPETAHGGTISRKGHRPRGRFPS